MGGLDASQDWTALLGGFILAGAGVGLINPVIADVAVSVVPKEHSGMASGINDTFRQVGIAVGIAAWGAIFLGRGADEGRAAGGGHPRRHRRPAPRAGGGGVLRQPRHGRGLVARRQPRGRRGRGPRGLPRRA